MVAVQKCSGDVHSCVDLKALNETVILGYDHSEHKWVWPRENYSEILGAIIDGQGAYTNWFWKGGR